MTPMRITLLQTNFAKITLAPEAIVSTLLSVALALGKRIYFVYFLQIMYMHDLNTMMIYTAPVTEV